MASDLNDLYFNWLGRLVCTDDNFENQMSYSKLLKKLYDSDFIWNEFIPNDANRAYDGLNLRYRFGEENGFPDYIISSEIDIKQCSILEMMVSLSIHCASLMDTPDAELCTLTSNWFWKMISNLGLLFQNDKKYDDAIVENILYIFLNRKYESDGRGNIFIVRNKNIRNTELWWQMCWAINEESGICKDVNWGLI